MDDAGRRLVDRLGAVRMAVQTSEGSGLSFEDVAAEVAVTDLGGTG